MHATVFLDVLSHWCLAAVPAVQSLYDANVDVELVLAPVRDGAPLGVSPELEQWAYTRGARAYGLTLRADWYETSDTTTWHANAAVLAGVALGADFWRLTCAVMSQALQGGALFGRPDVAYAFVASLGSVDAAEIKRLAEGHDVVHALHDGSRRLADVGGDERPTFRIRNASNDHVVLKGLWQRDAVDACVRALRADEEAYAAAGTPPVV